MAVFAVTITTSDVEFMTDTETIKVPKKPVPESTHWAMFGLCLAVLVTAALLPVPEATELRIYGFKTPEICVMKWYGFDCPACGLTRSFICLAHGQWRRAFEFNHIGPLFFALVALQLPYRYLAVRRPELGARLSERSWWAFPAILLLMFGNWLVLKGLSLISRFYS